MPSSRTFCIFAMLLQQPKVNLILILKVDANLAVYSAELYNNRIEYPEYGLLIQMLHIDINPYY